MGRKQGRESIPLLHNPLSPGREVGVRRLRRCIYSPHPDPLPANEGEGIAPSPAGRERVGERVGMLEFIIDSQQINICAPPYRPYAAMRLCFVNIDITSTAQTERKAI